MFITPKEVSNKMRDIAYDAYWNRTVNAGFKEVIAAVINEWDGARWNTHFHEGFGDSRFITNGLILPIERKD